MTIKKLLPLVLGLLILMATVTFSQEVSEKKEIAVFKLGHTSAGVPGHVLGDIDEEIKGVFIGIGRFNVMGMTQRLEAGDLNQFIDQLKQLKEKTVEIPDEVQMGKAFFTEADLNRLIGSFIVVVPSVTNYLLEQEEGKDYQAVIKTAFNFINVQEGRTFAHFTMETEGKDESADQAIREAVNAIPFRLTYEIRRIPEFQIKTGILEVRRQEVILEFGRDMGLKLGDEYAIVASRILGSGKSFTTETGLIIIKQVSDEVSVGQIIYAQGGPQIGDQLVEIPRLGLDTSPYVHVTLLSLDPESEPTVLAGFRQSITRGFYGFRPVLGLEVPFRTNILWGLPFNVYLGGQWDLYFGKLQVVPMANFGVGFAYLWWLEKFADVKDPFLVSHIGGSAGTALTYLLSKSFRFVLEGGYLHWFSLDPTGGLLFDSYSGIFVGGGINIRY